MIKMPERFDALRPWFIAGLGGLLNCLYLYYKKKGRFNWGQTIVSTIMSGFVGFAVGACLPEALPARDALIALSGVLGYQIWEAINDGGLCIIKAYLKHKLTK